MMDDHMERCMMNRVRAQSHLDSSNALLPSAGAFFFVAVATLVNVTEILRMNVRLELPVRGRCTKCVWVPTLNCTEGTHTRCIGQFWRNAACVRIGKRAEGQRISVKS